MLRSQMYVALSVISYAQAPPYDGSVYVHVDISQTISHSIQFK